MNSFVLALASIALVLVNLGIGWTLAKYHSRFRPEPAEPELPGQPATPDIDAPDSLEDTTTGEQAPPDDPELELAEFSMIDSDVREALATAAAPEYYS
jgi:hypothetical protein